MHDARLDRRGRKLALWNYLVACEIQHGTQFLIAHPEGALYVVLGLTGEILALPRAGRGGERWFAYLHTVYGLAEREDEAKFIYDVLRSYVITHGTRVELRRFAAYNLATQTAYVTGYNGRMYRLDGDEILDLACGEDGVFFVDDDPGTPCAPDIGAHGILLDWLTNLSYASAGLSGITPEQQRMALTIWLFALALPDLMPTKPLLLLEGTPGAGKTAAISLIQTALMGVARPMQLQRNKEDDFGVLLLRSPIALFDNVDAYIDWVPDAVCAYATGGVWTKRKLFTDDEAHTLKPHAFIAIASKNPASFRRSDVADRSIVLRLERRSRFRRFERLATETLQQRGLLLGEYLWYVNQIVADLRAHAVDADEEETHRMADFAGLGRIVGRVLGWSADAITGLMHALQGERDAFVNEEDPLVDVLAKWIAYRPRSGIGNLGRLVPIFTLATELEAVALASQVPWKHTPRSLNQALRSPHVERNFRIEFAVLNGHHAYQIWRASDPQLGLVSG